MRRLARFLIEAVLIGPQFIDTLDREPTTEPDFFTGKMRRPHGQ